MAVSDIKDGTITGISIEWFIGNSVIGTGSTLELHDLQEGEYTITISAIDSDNNTRRKDLSFEIVPNNKPQTTIYTYGESTYYAGDNILLNGKADDPEEGELIGTHLQWFCGNRLLGTGKTITVNDIETGTHTISFWATDSYGMSDHSSIIIHVIEKDTAPPSLLSTVPSDGKTNVDRNIKWFSYKFNEDMQAGISLSTNGKWLITETTPREIIDERNGRITRDDPDNPLPALTVITFTFNPSEYDPWFMDLAGNPLPETTITFTTGE